MSVLDSARGLYVEGIEQGLYKTAIKKYAVDSYKQHSTGVKTGASGFIEFFEDFVSRNPERKLKIIHGFEQENFAFLFVLQNINGVDSWVTMDIFKANSDGMITEHWDIIEEYKDPSQISGNFDFTNNEYDLEAIVKSEQGNLNNFLGKLANYDFQNVKIHQMVRFQNYVAVLIGFTDKIEYAGIQLYKFDDEQLVDMWDAVEPIVSLDIAKNEGKF